MQYTIHQEACSLCEVLYIYDVLYNSDKHTSMDQELKRLIGEGKTKKAIQRLLLITKDDNDLHQEVIIQSARFEEMTRNSRMGIASHEENNISRARVNSALLDIISRLDNTNTSDNNPTSSSSSEPIDTPPSGKPWRVIVGISIILTIIASTCAIMGVDMGDLFGGGSPESFNVTVLVHGKEGKDDLILQNQGEVRLDIGSDSRTEAIDKDGEATFKELPTGYDGKLALVSIKHDQPYLPTERNKEYKLERGKAIYLEVELKGIDKIKGRITDETTGNPLDSVRVIVENLTVYTDETGWYEMTLPIEKQAKTVSVTFIKKGYQTETVGQYAPHTKQALSFPLKRR